MLDTHIALWLDNNDHLRSSNRVLIDGCWQNGGTVRLSAVSVREIALLVDSRQVELASPIEAWIMRFLEHPGSSRRISGIEPLCRSYRLYQLEHRDPADRRLLT